MNIILTFESSVYEDDDNLPTDQMVCSAFAVLLPLDYIILHHTLILTSHCIKVACRVNVYPPTHLLPINSVTPSFQKTHKITFIKGQVKKVHDV